MLASSTVMTPSLPTLSIASAISSPIARSWAEMVATLAISSLVSTSRAPSRSRSVTAATAASMPRLRLDGEAPAATLRMPSRTMAWASTVAVVVPSPATSLVLVATSLASWAPRFSNESSSSISRAMVTPSLVIVGAPYFLSITTLRPSGPRVTLTASASLLTPRSSARLAVSSNCRVLAMVGDVLRLGGVRHAGFARREDDNAPGGRTNHCRAARGGVCLDQRQRDVAWSYFSMTASTSRAERTRRSSPLCLTSVPPYLL